MNIPDRATESNPDRIKWIAVLATFLKYAAGISAAGYVIMYIVVAAIRISYPFELEWMEGVTVDHVQRILDGKLLYVPPSVDFVPTIYTPLYYYVSAIPAALFGNGLVPVRLITLLASLGSMALLYSFVRRETKDGFAGLVGAGLYAATYYLTGCYLDLARVDSLFVFFLLAALWVLRFYPARVGYVLAALLTTLSFLTKQTALLAAVFFLIYAVKRRKENGWYFVGAFILFTGLAVWLLDLVHHGWFTFYVFEVPAKHPLDMLQFGKFWAQDILRPLPLASLFGLFFLTVCWLRGKVNDLWFYVLTGMGFLAAAGAPRIKDGNYVNDLIPAYAFIALIFGVAIPVLYSWGRELLEAVSADYPHRSRTASCLYCLFPALIAVQLAMLVYGPQNQIPTVEDRTAGEMLVRKISEFKGDVWVTHHGYLSVMAGKRSHAMSQPLNDVLYADNKRVNRILTDDVERALREEKFAAIITDQEDGLNLKYRPDYVAEPVIYAEPDAFYPISDYQTRPTTIFVPASRCRPEEGIYPAVK